MSERDLSLHAHLLRRAGFGARIDELEKISKKPYEQVVVDLLNPESQPDIEWDITQRYYSTGNHGWNTSWWHRMLNSERRLQEKMVIFWHYIFATGLSKDGASPSHYDQIEMFRKYGMGDLRTLLIKLSQDPAMIFWLDNNENLKDELNENYGRELLELFSMGVGNYTEGDVKGAAQAFTGWTFSTPLLEIATKDQGYSAGFVYDATQHNDGEKAFLGHNGKFNGEDIVDIIVKQPATARFIARQMYAFFVADEPAVAAWNEIPPQDPKAIEALEEAYFKSDGNITAMLRVLFNSDFFKDAKFKRVKTPLELVMGVYKLTAEHQFPSPGYPDRRAAIHQMGQGLLNPLTVEGWPRGMGWIDGGTLNNRVNSAVDMIDDANTPGVKMIVSRLSKLGKVTPEQLVDKCIEFVAPAPIRSETRKGLLQYAESGGVLDFTDPSKKKENEARVLRTVQLIVATREYQFV
ncbi:MAG: DUF1800 domain-containing protein [SAR202 cluster bacterium]|nr:DUF1800 domain-containing protein [SAR202 cluster bacterium]